MAKPQDFSSIGKPYQRPANPFDEFDAELTSGRMSNPFDEFDAPKDQPPRLLRRLDGGGPRIDLGETPEGMAPPPRGMRYVQNDPLAPTRYTLEPMPEATRPNLPWNEKLAEWISKNVTPVAEKAGAAVGAMIEGPGNRMGGAGGDLAAGTAGGLTEWGATTIRDPVQGAYEAVDLLEPTHQIAEGNYDLGLALESLFRGDVEGAHQSYMEATPKILTGTLGVIPAGSVTTSALIRSASKPTGASLASQVFKPGPTANERAADLIIKKMQADGLTFEQIGATARSLANRGDSGIYETLSEVAAQTGVSSAANLRGLAMALGAVPGKAQEALFRRVAENSEKMGARVSRSASRATGQKAEDTVSTLQDLDARLKRESGPRYETFYSSPVDQRVFANEVLPMLNTEVGQTAAKQALGAVKAKEARLRARVAGGKATVEERRELEHAVAGVRSLEAYLADPVTGTAIPSPYALNRIKRAFDNQVASAGFGSEIAKDVGGVKRDFAEAVSNATGGTYGEALGFYEGENRLKEALKIGLDALKKPTWELKLQIAEGIKGRQLSGGEIEAMALGVARYIDDLVEANDQAALTKLTKGKALKNLSTVLDDPKAAAMFDESIQRLAANREWGRKVSGGSDTAMRLAAIDDASRLEEDPITRAIDRVENATVPPSIPGMLQAIVAKPIARAAKDAYRRLKYPGIRDPEVNAALAPIMSTPLTKKPLEEIAATIEARLAAKNPKKALPVIEGKATVVESAPAAPKKPDKAGIANEVVAPVAVGSLATVGPEGESYEDKLARGLGAAAATFGIGRLSKGLRRFPRGYGSAKTAGVAARDFADDTRYYDPNATDQSLQALKDQIRADGIGDAGILLFKTDSGRVIAVRGADVEYSHDAARRMLGLGDLKLKHGVWNPKRWPTLADMDKAGDDAWYATTGTARDTSGAAKPDQGLLVYRGSAEDEPGVIGNGRLGLGVYSAEQPEIGAEWGGPTGKVEAYRINGKLFDLDETTSQGLENYEKQANTPQAETLFARLKKEGYVGVRDPWSGHINVFDARDMVRHADADMELGRTWTNEDDLVEGAANTGKSTSEVNVPAERASSTKGTPGESGGEFPLPRGFKSGRGGRNGEKKTRRDLEPRDIVLGYNEPDFTARNLAIDLGLDANEDDATNLIKVLASNTRNVVRDAIKQNRLTDLAKQWRVTPDELEKFVIPRKPGNVGKAEERLRAAVEIIESYNKRGETITLPEVTQRLNAKGIKTGESTIETMLTAARTGSRKDLRISDELVERVKKLKMAPVGRPFAQGFIPDSQYKFPDPTAPLADLYGLAKKALLPDDPRQLNQAQEAFQGLEPGERAWIVSNARREQPLSAMQAADTPQGLAELVGRMVSRNTDTANKPVDTAAKRHQTRLADAVLADQRGEVVYPRKEENIVSFGEPIDLINRDSLAGPYGPLEVEARRKERQLAQGSGRRLTTDTRKAQLKKALSDIILEGSREGGGFPATGATVVTKKEGFVGGPSVTPLDRLRGGISRGYEQGPLNLNPRDEQRLADLIFDPAQAQEAARMVSEPIAPWVSDFERNAIRVGVPAAGGGGLAAYVLGNGAPQAQTDDKDPAPSLPEPPRYNVSDRIMPKENPVEPPPHLNPHNRETVIMAQKRLVALGYLPGEFEEEADGVVGPKTSRAIAAFQSANGLPQTGEFNQATLRALWGGADYTMTPDPMLRQYGEPQVEAPR